LLNEQANADGVRTLLGKPTPCVGRDREIAALVSLYDESSSEPVARAALLIGAAGVGKSRLRYEMTEILRKRSPAPQIVIARRDPKLMGDQMRRAWIDLCAAESAAGPLVLLIDDVQWGDLPSLDLADAALRSLSGAPILLVGFARPEVADRFPSLWEELRAE